MELHLSVRSFLLFFKKKYIAPLDKAVERCYINIIRDTQGTDDMAKKDWTMTDFGGGEFFHYQGKFVARFRSYCGRGEKTRFRKFLVDNFTPAEYFEELKTNPPLLILKKKGYVSVNEEKAKVHM
jgi:hypothetical protein